MNSVGNIVCVSKTCSTRNRIGYATRVNPTALATAPFSLSLCPHLLPQSCPQGWMSPVALFFSRFGVPKSWTWSLYSIHSFLSILNPLASFSFPASLSLPFNDAVDPACFGLLTFLKFLPWTHGFSSAPDPPHSLLALSSPDLRKCLSSYLDPQTKSFNKSLRDAHQVLLHNLVLVSGVLRGTRVLYSWSGEERSHWGI